MSIRKIRFVALIVSLIVAAISSYAQDEVTGVPSNILGTYIIDIQSGSFTSVDASGTYQLEVVGLEDDITWVFNAPEFRAGRIGKANLTLDWAAAEGDVRVQGILTTDDEVIVLTLFDPIMGDDYNTILYTAVVEQLIPLYEVNPKIGVTLPETFEIATLAIETNTDFEAALLRGATRRLETVREVSATRTCIQGRNCPENDPLYRGNSDSGSASETPNSDGNSDETQSADEDQDTSLDDVEDDDNS
jgi:hypothetical protein